MSKAGYYWIEQDAFGPDQYVYHALMVACSPYMIATVRYCQNPEGEWCYMAQYGGDDVVYYKTDQLQQAKEQMIRQAIARTAEQLIDLCCTARSRASDRTAHRGRPRTHGAPGTPVRWCVHRHVWHARCGRYPAAQRAATTAG